MTHRIGANLRTARLLLRPLAAEDAAAVVTALNDAAVARWLARCRSPVARGKAVGALHFALNRAETDLVPRPRPPRPQAQRAKPAPFYEFGMNA